MKAIKIYTNSRIYVLIEHIFYCEMSEDYPF